MNQQPSSSKQTIIIIVILIIAVVGYYFYSTGSPTSETELEQKEVNFSNTQAAGARVLSLLNQVTSLKIDPSIFTSAAYKSLMDNTIDVPEQNVGRANPFAPLNGFVQPTPIPTPRTTGTRAR